jgi:hypothetical protein
MLWKAIVGVVVVVAAAVGGATLYIRHQVTTTLAQAASHLSPIAELRYAGVSITPNGTVRIRNVEIRPRLFDDPLRIEGIVVETPGLWFLLTGSKRFREGQLPQHLRATVRGLTVNLAGPIAESFDRAVAAAAHSSGVAAVSNCGDLRVFDSSAYRRLGYRALVFDVALGYRFEKDRGPLRVSTELRVREVGVATVTVDLVDVSPTVRDNVGRQAPLGGFEVVYQDLSYTDRLKRYCAQASGASVQHFVEAEVDRTLAVWAHFGIAAGPGLRQAFQEFLTRPGEIRLKALPSPPVDVLTLRLLKPDDALARLNLRLSINGKAVTDVGTIAARAVPPTAAPPPPEAVASVASGMRRLPDPPPPVVSAATPPPSAPAPAASEFRAVSPTDLDQHVGKTVRVQLTRGAIHEGRLLPMRGGAARVERRLQGGSITVTIPLADIQRLDVLP